MLFEFAISSDNEKRHIFAKVPFPSSQRSAAKRTPPRFFPKPIRETKAKCEFDTLSAIFSQFHSGPSASLSAIKMFDLLEDRGIIIMEKANGTCLNDWLRFEHRFSLRRSPLDIEAALRNTGAWLRKFHSMPDFEHTKKRHTTVSDIRASADCLFEYFRRCSGGKQEKLVARIESGIDSQLNGELPLGLSHSDFTPPNILIDARGCVTVIDTLASWRAPVYDDLARLSVGLEFSFPQTASHGLWYPPSFVRQLEQSFWESYFGSDEVNKSAIRVFQCILGLERWVAYHFRHSAANGWKRVVKNARARWFGRHIEKKLREWSAEF